MPIAEHSKLEVATEHLHAAIILYLDHRAYFAAIHLGAQHLSCSIGHLRKRRRTGELLGEGKKALHRIEKGREATNTEISEVVNGAKECRQNTWMMTVFSTVTLTPAGKRNGTSRMR